MAIELLEGTAQHRGLLGEKGGYIVATNNANFAKAFGKDVSGKIGVVKKSKISMYRINGVAYSSGEKQGIVSVDPRELNRIDALQYVYNHTGEVFDWTELARAFGDQYSSQFDIETYAVKPGTKFSSLSDFLQATILKLHFGQISLEEAKEIFNADNANPDVNKNLSDMLARRVKNLNFEETSRVAGVEFTIFAKSGNAVKIVKNDNAVKVKLDIFSSVLGNKSRARKEERSRFVEVKKVIEETCAKNSEDCTYSFVPNNLDESIEDLYAEIFADLRTRLKQTIKEITSDSKFVDYPDFNRASALSKLWNVLGLGSDVNYGGIDEQLLERFWRNEITGFEFALAPENSMVKRIIKTVVSKRLDEKNIDLESFSKQLTDKLSADYILEKNPSKNYSRIREIVKNDIILGFEQLRQDVSETTTFSEAYKYYSCAIMDFTKYVRNFALERFLDRYQDYLKTDVKTMRFYATESLGRELEKNITNAYDRFVENIRLNNVKDALQPQLPEKVKIKHVEPLLEEFMNRYVLSSDIEEINDRVFEFVNSKGDSYYDGLVQNMYDYESGLELGRNVILENISISIKYKFVQKNYLREILNSIDSMPIICFFADPDNTELFINRYAPDWESNLDKNAIIAEKNAKKVKELLVDNRILEKFSLSMKELLREKLEEFSSFYGLTCFDVYAPATLASDAYAETVKDDSVIKNIINSLVAEFGESDVEDYLKLIPNQVKSIKTVGGLSFNTLYLKIYNSTNKYTDIAVQNLTSLASILPPYRKKSREYWQHLFSEAIKDPSKTMKLISFADKGDVANAVDLIDLAQEIQDSSISLKILGGAFDDYKEYFTNKLSDKKITINGDLVNGSEINKLFANSLPAVIETYFVENMQNITKDYDLDDGILVVNKKVAKEFFDKIIKNAINMVVSYSFVPQALNRAKEILIDSLQETLKSDNYPESASILLTKAIDNAKDYNHFPYAEKHDALGFLNEYYPEWNDTKQFNGLFDDSGNIREELKSSWNTFEQEIRNSAIDLSTEIICNELYTNLPPDTKLELVYGSWVEEKIDRFVYIVLSEMVGNLSNKTISQQQKILADRNNYKSQEASAYLRSQLTKENVDKYALSKVKQEILAHLKTYFTLAGTLSTSAEDLALWNNVANRLMGYTDLTWIRLYEAGELEEFIKNYIPELQKRDNISSADDIRKILDGKLDDTKEKITFSLTNYLKEDLNYKFISEKDIEEYADHLAKDVSDSIKNEVLTNVNDGRIYTEDDVLETYSKRVDQYIKRTLRKFCNSSCVTKINDHALELAINEVVKTDPYREKGLSFWNAKFKLLPIDGNFANLAHTKKIDELVETYAPDWNDQLTADEQDLRNRLENSFRNRVMTIIREKFTGDRKLLLSQTPYKNSEGLLNYVISEKFEALYLEFKNYIKNRNSVEVVRNFCRRRVLVEELKKFISAITTPEDEIRKLVITKLRKLFGDSIEESDIQKIMDSSISTPHLIKSLEDIKARNEILKGLGITAKFDISKKLELLEVQVSIYDQVGPLIYEYASAEPFQEYLVDRKLANDGFYGRKEDANASARKNFKRIQYIIISKITREWYNNKEFDQLFTAENRDILAKNVSNEFDRLKPIKFFNPLFSTMVKIFVSRIEELFTSAIENSFKPWLKQTKPYNKISLDYVNDRLVVARSNNGKDNLISIASHNGTYESWIEKYMSAWKSYVDDSMENDKDNIQSTDKVTIRDVLAKELEKIFNSGIYRLVEKNNFPQSIAVAIKNSGQIESLVKEHTNYLLDSAENVGLYGENIDEVKEFIVEDNEYTDDEIDYILSLKIDLGKIRTVLQKDLVSALLSTGEDSELEIQRLTDKLSVEEMAEYYSMGDRNFRNKYIR